MMNSPWFKSPPSSPSNRSHPPIPEEKDDEVVVESSDQPIAATSEGPEWHQHRETLQRYLDSFHPNLPDKVYFCQYCQLEYDHLREMTSLCQRAMADFIRRVVKQVDQHPDRQCPHEVFTNLHGRFWLDTPPVPPDQLRPEDLQELNPKEMLNKLRCRLCPEGCLHNTPPNRMEAPWARADE